MALMLGGAARIRLAKSAFRRKNLAASSRIAILFHQLRLGPPLRARPPRSAPPMPLELDATDLRILAQLQRDSSLSNQALAEAVHVSPATALRRVRRLVEGGVIERQVAVLSPAALG